MMKIEMVAAALLIAASPSWGAEAVLMNPPLELTASTGAPFSGPVTVTADAGARIVTSWYASGRLTTASSQKPNGQPEWSRAWHPNGRLATHMSFHQGYPLGISHFTPQSEPVGFLAYRGEWPWTGSGTLYHPNGRKKLTYEYRSGRTIQFHSWQADGTEDPPRPSTMNARAAIGLTLEEPLPTLTPDQWDRALAAQQALAEANPKRASIHRVLGTMLAQSHRAEEALTAYLESLAVDPWNVSAYRAASELQLTLRRPAEALTLADQGLELAPEDPVLLRLKENAGRLAVPIPR